MRLISELIGYGPMPVPDQEVEQRLTLNSRGQLWFSNYLYGDGVKYKLHHKERRTISSTDAENILQAVSKMFASPQTYALIADVGMWRMTLLNEVGQYFEYEGALASYGENDPLGVISDELRKTFARTADAKERKYKAGDFSYNTGKLRCPVCDGTGEISLDVQFLPDVDIPCPECRGSRYAKDAEKIKYTNKKGESYSLPELMDMNVSRALQACKDLKLVRQRLQVLEDLGLGYLTLGEETPSLSGGEAQRLKLASEMGKTQSDSVFVFDEPTIGLHPLDVRTLLGVFQTLIDHGATVIVIEHDLDVIRNADYIIDMGPGGGDDGGRIVAVGTPEEIRETAESITGKYI